MTLADLDKEAEKRPVSRREFYMVGYRAALSECLQVVEEERARHEAYAHEAWSSGKVGCAEATIYANQRIAACERIATRLREIGAVHD